MSVATEYLAPAPRPRLRVIHSCEPLVPAAPVPAGAHAQGELPLLWPTDRNGERAKSSLARYPAIPLSPGTPRPEPFVAHAAALVTDVLAGARPATQLHRCATPEVQQRLARRSALRGQSRGWTGRPARVTSTSTMVVSGSVAQATVVFFIGQRAHGAALRLEYRHRRWVVTDVQTPA